MRSAGAAQACCKQRERANSAESSQAERRWEAGICRGSYKRLTPYSIVMFPVFAVERAKTGVCFVAGDRVTLCQKGAEHEVQIQVEMCNFFFCFFAGAFYAPAGAGK